jgi:heat shock protein HslJ
MRLISPLCIALLLGLALTGCRASQELVGTWTLESLEATAGSPPLPAPGRTTPRITFEAPNDRGEGKLSGFGGVNRFFGNYQTGSGSIAIGALGATRMAGPTELMTLEKVLLGVIQRAQNWKVKDDSLLLTGTAGEATFAREQEQPAP